MAGRFNSLEARDVAYYLHPFTDLSAHEKEGPDRPSGRAKIWPI
jgi:hypothetical protein